MKSGPAFLHYGFRPFFLLAALHASLALPLWLWIYASGTTIQGPFTSLSWHAHEMIFGYLGAVIAGFVLTAVPNWTGRLPLSGAPLALLVVLWIAGRLACAFAPDPVLAMLVDLAFPAALGAAVWREVIAGKNWKNGPVAAMLTLFALGNLLHHLEAAGIVSQGLAIRVALGTAMMLIALIGGRIVPSFTRNWLVKRNEASLPAPFGRLDKTALVASAAAVLAWIVLPGTPVSAFAFVIGGILLTARLSRWRGWRTVLEPILLVLHIGYGWLGISMVLLGMSMIFPRLIPEGSALHALTAGAIGTMTLAVMTRASLGHTGRAIRADGWTIAIYAAVTVGAVLRVLAPIVAHPYLAILTTGGIVWTGAFVMFVARYGPVLTKHRVRDSTG